MEEFLKRFYEPIENGDGFSCSNKYTYVASFEKEDDNTEGGEIWGFEDYCNEEVYNALDEAMKYIKYFGYEEV